MDRWEPTYAQCIAWKWVPRRARGEGRARPPLRQHPTPPRRRRHPHPHSRYHRHPREVRGRVPAPNLSPRAEEVVSHSRAGAPPSPVATPRSTSRRRRRSLPSRSQGLGIYGLRFRVYWFMVYGFNYKNLLMIVFCGVVLSRAGRLFVPCLQGKARRAVRPPSG